MPKLSPAPGIGMLLVIFLTSMLLSLMGALAAITFNLASAQNLESQRAQAFYLAEAAIERGKSEVNQNPLWYTELSRKSDKNWIINSARGQEGTLKTGKYKVIRPQNINIIYGVGFTTNSICVVKLEYELPIKSLNFSIL